MRMRCHISIIFESLWQFIAVIVLIAIQQIDTIVDLVKEVGTAGIEAALASGGLWGLLGLVIVLLIILGIQFLRWRKTWITLDGNLIIVERNTLRKVKNTIAIENLSTVNMEQNLFERIVGTYRIKMDTNSSATANTTDISIVFAEDRAIAFRKAVLEKMGELKGFAREEILSEEKRPDQVIEEKRKGGAQVFHYGVSNMLAHCFFSMSLFNLLIVILGIGGFSWYVSNFGLMTFIREWLGGMLVLVLMVLGAAWDLIKRFITYYDFTVYRESTDLHLRYGLLKLRSYTIPVDKITCLEIYQPVFSRFFGRYQAKVITVGIGNENEESANLTMALPKAKFLEQLSVLLPEYAEENPLEGLESQDSKALLVKGAKLIKWGILLGACCLIAGKYMDFPEIPVLATKWLPLGWGLCMLLIAIMYLLSYKTAGYIFEEERAILASGIFQKRIHLCNYSRMQNVELKMHPLMRRHHVVCGSIHLLNKAVLIPYMREEVAEQMNGRMIAHRWGSK
ncbi:MAG: PH domain-containing protein [Firmicutes bacterium]|nr:PH domain-containing protein [Bacillota bacterium]